MMRLMGEDLKVYLHRAPVDMRRGRNGLSALVKEAMGQDPFASGSAYVFIGRKFNALKVLIWDINGFSVFHKVIESREKFHWPRLFEQEVVDLTAAQMNWLLDGYDVWAMPHRPVNFLHAG